MKLFGFQMEKGMKTDNEKKKKITPSFTSASGFDDVLFISLSWFDPCLKNNFYELLHSSVKTVYDSLTANIIMHRYYFPQWIQGHSRGIKRQCKGS